MNPTLQAFPLVDTTRAPEPPPSGVNNSVGDQLLTVNDAARLLRVTVSWVYEHTRDDAEDRLPFVKLGKYVRFDRTDLREYIDAKRRASRNGARRR
jgi:excisionase family DNA binding protein